MRAGRRSEKRSSEAPRLFEPEELRLRPIGAARRVARSPLPRGPVARKLKRSEDRRAMDQLEGWGADLARRFGLSYKALEAERDGVNGHYGICYEDGVIRIRLRHATTGRLLKESSLVDTLCHELAHLRYFDHGPRFKALYLRILDDARQAGYYRPGPAGPRPRQATLFDDSACGTRAGGGDARPPRRRG